MDRWDHQEPLLQGARRERGNFQAHHEDERWKSQSPAVPAVPCVRKDNVIPVISGSGDPSITHAKSMLQKREWR